MEDFVVRAERIRGGGVDPSVDNFLKITHEARLLGTDARLIDKDAPSNPDGKLNKVAENVWKEYENDLEASKTEYDKPFAYSKELEEKLARQCELNAQLDLENAKAVDADLSGPEEEREADDRMESAAIVAEDKGAYPADRGGRTR